MRLFLADMGALGRAIWTDFYRPLFIACTVGFARAVRDEIDLVRWLRSQR